jgi:hypothetical protein
LQDATEDLADRLSLTGSFGGKLLGGGRRLGQREHLVKRALVGDQISLAQLGAAVFEFLGLEVEMAADRRVGVVTESLDIGDGDQEQVEGQGSAVAGLEVTVADQTMVNLAEARRHLTEPVWPDQTFLDHSSQALLTRVQFRGSLGPGFSFPPIPRVSLAPLPNTAHMLCGPEVIAAGLLA